ncbi:MAG TPA: hypothetical protein VK901_01410 [Nitrospiraceae bacterium]|nr:hypothetical protein [Nitrospiraceae bacterium]
MAGSQDKGGIAGGRIYRLEGSWYPIDPLIGGPLGIPGSPRPAEPKFFLAPELVEEPPLKVGTDVGPTLAWPDTPAFGSASGVCIA